MAVTVNEVEVSPAEQKPEPAPEKGAGEPPSPDEIQRMLEQQISRCERVWAH
jgi:hypothetical protein